MTISLEHNGELISIWQQKFFILWGALLIVPVTLLLSFWGIASSGTLVLISAPLILMALFSFDMIFGLMVISLFLNYGIYYFAVSEIVAFFVICSFFITYRFKACEIKNNLLPTFLIFIASVCPSYFNSLEVFEPKALTMNIVLLFFLFTFVSIALSSYDHIRKFLKLYVLMSLINGLHVIAMALVLHRRVFGFAGVMYVDYVGIAIVIVLTTLLFIEKRRLLNSFLLLVLLAALLFTQTRNAWISSALMIVIILSQFIMRSPELGFSRKKVILITIVVSSLILLMVPLIQSVSPETFKRLAESRVKTSEGIASNFYAISSLATRFFIWETAYNAFLAHPVIGIGFYAFPFVSNQYYTISPILFELFVEKLTPHLTYITLLTETGIVGFLGFMIFLITTVRKAKRNISKSKTKEEKFYSILIFNLIIYSVISMSMTDAWLALHGIVLWGFILCLSVANGKIIDNSFSRKLSVENKNNGSLAVTN